MWKIIVLCMIVGLAATQKATFRDYKVFRIVPTTEIQVEILREFQEISDGVSTFLNTNTQEYIDQMIFEFPVSFFEKKN